MAFEEIIFPKIQDFYEDSFRNLSVKKIDELYESSKFLNNQLFEKYLRNKLIKIRVIVRKGILYSGFDWYYITIPHGNIYIYICIYILNYFLLLKLLLL